MNDCKTCANAALSAVVGSPCMQCVQNSKWSNNREERHTNFLASDFLHRAAGIMADRGKQYDKPEGERSMGKCVQAFNLITGHTLTESEGWLLLQVLKDVRQWQRPGFHLDSADDCIAYASLKAEAKQREAA